MQPIIPPRCKLHTLLLVLNRLQRLERLVRAAKTGCLSPSESRTVHRAVRRLRKMVSPSVMACYAKLRSEEPELADRPELFSLAVALSHFGRMPSATKRRKPSLFENRIRF